ncbi:hypothetical protein [Wolbachia endosymbiont of Rhagoletis cingulata]|uniref:hypothetical protein n=1 Tax=Wolbachia endosymbiont of Rhagoletis cingulata TaxID=1220542 RepID=UPI003AF3DEA5
MPLTNYEYRDGESFYHAIAEGFKKAEKYMGIPGAASGAGQYAMNNKVKTGAIALGTLLVLGVTAAYFLSPAYAAFVGTVGTKAATLVSPAITAMSTFAIAHPLVASLVVLAAVAALITATVYAYKNSGKSEEIKALNSNIDTIAVTVNDEGKNPDTKINELKALSCLAQTRSA